MDTNIFSYIKGREKEYESQSIRVGDNYEWQMRDHIQLIFHLKNGKFYKGENDYLRAFKLIMRPLLRLSYWTEDLEVKDVVFYSEDDNGKVLSFLIKKYHDSVYVKENNLDELFDDITESDIDYGGVILQKGLKCPEVVDLLSVAFCDQTNIVGGAIGFKHYFSSDKMREMKKVGWGDKKNGATISIEELCVLASAEKSPAGDLGKKNIVTSKTIEVYIIRGSLPESFIDENADADSYCNQIQIVAFYTKKNGEYNGKEGCILYRKKDEEGDLMFHSSEKIYGRALGYSDGESFIQPQIWSNFLTIHKMNMLESASKIPLVTNDLNFTQKNKIQEMENLEITTIQDGKSINQIPTAAPANLQLLSNAVDEWFNHSQFLGSAFDPILGKEPVSGTTFRGQERLVSQGRGWHDRRRGKRAKFIEEVYRKWIMPDIVKEINKGKKFLATLSSDELTWVAENVAINIANKRIKEKILGGQSITPEEQKNLITLLKDFILKDGREKIFETLKGEFSNVDIKVNVNVAGKQKNLALLSDKLLSVFQAVFANPQGFQTAMQIPSLAKAFGDILEFGGMSVANFSSLLSSPAPSQIPIENQQQGSPIQLTPNEQPA